MIPFKRVNLGNSYKLVKPLFESGLIGHGDVVARFEEELANYVGSKYAVAVSSCTAALYLSLYWDMLNGTEEVSMPSMTFCLAVAAAIRAGMNVTLNSDTNWVGGRYLIKGSFTMDSAHELKRGCYKDLIGAAKLCFSFYPTKTIGSADGGAIATNDEKFVIWARKALMYGRVPVLGGINNWEYDTEMIGHKSNWNNLQAMIALEQLGRLDKTHQTMQMIAETYNEALGYANDSDYLYRIDVGKRDSFIEYMAKNGVECNVHFKPVHLMSPYKYLRTEGKDETEKAYETTVSLPFYDTLKVTEVLKIIDLVNFWRKRCPM